MSQYDELKHSHNKINYSTSNISILSQREKEVLYYSSAGKTYPEIATIMEIKITTVKFHIKNIVRKLDVINAKQAIRLGVELSLSRQLGLSISLRHSYNSL